MERLFHSGLNGGKHHHEQLPSLDDTISNSKRFANHTLSFRVLN